MSNDNFEEELTQEEAEELYRLLKKLNTEMNNRLQSGSAFDTGDVNYTTIVRNKQIKYLRSVYDVGDD